MLLIIAVTFSSNVTHLQFWIGKIGHREPFCVCVCVYNHMCVCVCVHLMQGVNLYRLYCSMFVRCMDCPLILDNKHNTFKLCHIINSATKAESCMAPLHYCIPSNWNVLLSIEPPPLL